MSGQVCILSADPTSGQADRQVSALEEGRGQVRYEEMGGGEWVIGCSIVAPSILKLMSYSAWFRGTVQCSEHKLTQKCKT